MQLLLFLSEPDAIVVDKCLDTVIQAIWSLWTPIWPGYALLPQVHIEAWTLLQSLQRVAGLKVGRGLKQFFQTVFKVYTVTAMKSCEFHRHI